MSTPTPTTTTTATGGLLGGANGGFSYVIGITAGILFLITTITLTSYFCTRYGGTSGAHHHAHVEADHVIHVLPPEGIHEDILNTYPTCLYSQLLQQVTSDHEDKKGNGNNNATAISCCCSICLTDYKGKDVIRVLPDCGHVFHLECVDTWLRSNTTCPLCRTSPLPTPQTTPLDPSAPPSLNIIRTL